MELFSLWLGAIKIIIIIKIMHRFKWWSCMLLTQYSKHLILMSQYSVPNLISDSQSDKEKKAEKARDIRWRHQSFLFCFFKLETEVCLHLSLSICQVGREITKSIFIFHPWDTTTHCTSAIPVWQYLKLNTYLQESQQNPPFFFLLSQFHHNCHMIWNTGCLPWH